MLFRGVIFFCSVGALVKGLHLPSTIVACSAADEACLIKSTENSFTVFAAGNKELEVPPLDPLNLGGVSIDPQPGPLSLAHKYNNVMLMGFSKINMRQLKIDLTKHTIYFDALLPELLATADYAIKGQILVFPIDASGSIRAVHRNMAVQANVTYEVFQKDGVEFGRLITCQLVTNSKDQEFDFGTFIKGNEELDKQVHQVINDDPSVLWESIRPTCEAAWAIVFQDIANKIFTNIPLNELFID